MTNPAGVLQIDTAAPTIAIAVPIAGDNTVNTGEAAAGFTISGTTGGLENGQTATITIVDSASAVVDSFITAVLGNAWSIDVTSAQAQALLEGAYTVQANVSDAAGNPAVPASQSLTVDKATPSIAIAPITGDDTVNLSEATAGFAITGTTQGIEDGQAATVTIVNSANAVVDSFASTVTGSAWTVSVSSAEARALADGSYTVRANVSDVAGNPAVQAIQGLTIDETAPNAPSAPLLAPGSDSGVTGDHVTNVVRPTFTGSAEAGSTVDLFDGTTLIGTGTADAVTGAWSITATTALTPGANTVVVRDITAQGSDTAGNTSAPSNPLTITLDTTIPTVSAVTASPGTADLAAGQVVMLTLTLSQAVTVTTTGGTPSLTLNDGGTASYVSGTGTSALVFSYTILAGQNTADLAITGSSLNGGTITDAAGNTADLAAAVTNPAGVLQIDTAVPTIAIAGPIAGDGTVNASEAATGFIITGTTGDLEDGQTATITIVDSTNAVVDSYAAVVTGNAWSIDVTSDQAQALAEGSYTVQANVSDVAGNAAVPASQSLAVDNLTPTITIAPISGDGTVNLSEATAGFAITGTTQDIENGQTATVAIVNSANTVVDSFASTITGNAWAVGVTAAQAGLGRRQLHGARQCLGCRRQPGRPGNPESDRRRDSAERAGRARPGASQRQRRRGRQRHERCPADRHRHRPRRQHGRPL